ncbi:hypothetical protein K435DRAFT_675044 [Dendrothele bispora CBS 962.96]|uniref:Association with the SNF1 complex (ASC) domain-containing protein n=1 Tax=Dendrothele bispora (strain CBS 962.96) TaxID=1314807 RepID=A0A4S8LP76_DENBC|nr:hypothetical protein K435DRAFT_693187 [Dendrothele bispora CBS 962.96]THU90971.1 hypothetical protein K435DRAFT_675044 [Dendrothele bispora CBS 962.96]
MPESTAEDTGAAGVVEPNLLPLPVTTASGTDVTAAIPEGLPMAKVFHGHVQRHHSHHNGSAHASRSSAVPTTLPAHALELQGDIHIADDPSMLPVPSHVVIHHLCTSAIRNGVLAIGETVRYRKKFVTTVYYKPAS